MSHDDRQAVILRVDRALLDAYQAEAEMRSRRSGRKVPRHEVMVEALRAFLPAQPADAA